MKKGKKEERNEGGRGPLITGYETRIFAASVVVVGGRRKRYRYEHWRVLKLGNLLAMGLH
jgi:hypothetical protein